MALKGDRIESAQGTEITYNMNEVGNKGGVVVNSTIGSGAALDQSLALVTYAATASGKRPVGILLCDMVNVDQTRQHINQHKNEVQKGGKVTILKKGWVVTDQLTSGITVTATNCLAYLADGGRITNVNAGEAATPLIGRFLSTPDEDGYAKVEINLP